MAEFLQFVGILITAGVLWFNAKQVKALQKQNAQNEKKARQRATIDLALHERTDANYIKCRQEFLQLKQLGTSLTIYACDINRYPKENNSLMNYLNHYEFLACGIFEEALDGEIYKRMRKTSILRDWEDLKPYVMELRNQRKNNRIYCELENLVKSWSD